MIEEGKEESDFNKQMLYVFDPEEIQFRKKLQMFGNMKLIVELYINGCLTENIILECVSSLFEEVTEINIEILTQMIERLGNHIVLQATKSEEDYKFSRGKKAKSQINLQYLQSICEQVFAFKDSD